ncbi:Protein of unknown function [Evansella caseinilytica]|uniref:DUF4227 family protein n=1 Tax=Evansella caseinilytica TaxID=1503961 RepID=A0A1H3L6S9_9BACI|nr:YqzK family protein [Evansella caseinilytica]SDY59634.1 Protein of unknown function [Evansella caseinilytica]
MMQTAVQSIKTFLEAILVFFLFLGCTLVFYYGILWVSGEYEKYHRYDEPNGNAVKVVTELSENVPVNETVRRFQYFLKHGE